MNKNLISENFIDYELIDSGYGNKLEKIAGITVVRPSPQAIWKEKKEAPDWKKATSICIRKNDGGGEWKHLRGEPKDLIFNYKTIQDKNLQFKLKLTSFGHCGVFFEQIAVWDALSDEIIRLQNKLKRPVRFLNLFGYTGCASIVALACGAEVVHVDSAKGVLTWGLDNVKLNELDDRKIKFIQEDVNQFILHSLKKGFKYDGILADPPSWGHGANKEKWEFEEMIHDMVLNCFNILSKENSFFFLSSHTHGVQSDALKNLMLEAPFKKDVIVGELGVKHKFDDRILPAGIYALAKNIN